MSDSIKLISVALDCPDAGARAAFYAAITGGKVTYHDDGWATVKAAGAAKYAVQPGDHFRVYADPAGHPFCLCVEDEPGQG